MRGERCGCAHERSTARTANQRRRGRLRTEPTERPIGAASEDASRDCGVRVERVEHPLAAARAAGRNPDDIGIESWISVGTRTPDDWINDVRARKAFGATHLSVNTMNAGITSVEGHIEAVRKFKEAVEGEL